MSNSKINSIIEGISKAHSDEEPISNKDWKLIKEVIALADSVSDKASKLAKLERIGTDKRYQLGDCKRYLQEGLAKLDDIIEKGK